MPGKGKLTEKPSRALVVEPAKPKQVCSLVDSVPMPSFSFLYDDGEHACSVPTSVAAPLTCPATPHPPPSICPPQKAKTPVAKVGAAVVQKFGLYKRAPKEARLYLTRVQGGILRFPLYSMEEGDALSETVRIGVWREFGIALTGVPSCMGLPERFKPSPHRTQRQDITFFYATATAASVAQVPAGQGWAWVTAKTLLSEGNDVVTSIATQLR